MSDDRAQQVAVQYARLDHRGQPMLRMPSAKEEADPQRRREREGSDWKIIYPDEAAAKAAALGSAQLAQREDQVAPARGQSGAEVPTGCR